MHAQGQGVNTGSESGHIFLFVVQVCRIGTRRKIIQLCFSEQKMCFQWELCDIDSHAVSSTIKKKKKTKLCFILFTSETHTELQIRLVSTYYSQSIRWIHPRQQTSQACLFCWASVDVQGGDGYSCLHFPHCMCIIRFMGNLCNMKMYAKNMSVLMLLVSLVQLSFTTFTGASIITYSNDKVHCQHSHIQVLQAAL